MRTSLMAAAAILMLCGLARGNLILNGGFNDGLGNPSAANWGFWGNAGLANWFPDGNPGHAAFYGDTLGNNGGVFQENISGSPGVTYQFTIDASFEANWNTTVQFGLEFYLADQSTKISDTMVAFNYGPVLGAGYETYVMQAQVPVGTVYVRPVASFGPVLDPLGSLQSATFDNAVLDVVPEPASALLLVAGAVLMGTRRRAG